MNKEFELPFHVSPFYRKSDLEVTLARTHTLQNLNSVLDCTLRQS